MASPIGHSLAGATIYLWSIKPGKEQLGEFLRRHWRPVLLFVILANLPDVDFILGWLTTGNAHAFHHQWTHSFTVAAGAALLAALAFKIRPSFTANWLWYFAVTGSHLLIDFFAGPELGWHRSYAMPLLWPFSNEQFSSPISLLIGARHRDASQLLSLSNWAAAAWEVLVFGAILGVSVMLKRRSGKDSASREQP
jgi:inner membrane protein